MLKFKIKMIVKENAKNKEPYPHQDYKKWHNKCFLRKKKMKD